jgi:anti-sigma regulatory factor (Ser/Thr protein kinase)
MAPDARRPTPAASGVPCAGGGAIEPLHMRFESHPQHIAPARVAVEQLCAEGGFERRACEEIGLAVNEALANVTRHAYGNAPDRPIELTARVGPDGLELKLRDWGSGTHPLHAAQSKPVEPKGIGDVPAPGGLGLMCMQRLMDEVVFEPQADGMLLTLRRRRRSGTPNKAG